MNAAPGDAQRPEPRAKRLRRSALRLECFTVGWSILEAVVGLLAGWMASSIALKGFGLDSVLEAVSGLAVLWRFRQARLGEAEAESKAVKLVGATFLALAVYIGYEASSDLWFKRAPNFSLPGMILAAVSLVVMPVLGFAKRRVADQLQSRALSADALETFLCAYLSAVLLLGLGLNAWLGWWWADPVAALAMIPLIVREAVEAIST